MTRLSFVPADRPKDKGFTDLANDEPEMMRKVVRDSYNRVEQDRKNEVDLSETLAWVESEGVLSWAMLNDTDEIIIQGRDK